MPDPDANKAKVFFATKDPGRPIEIHMVQEEDYQIITGVTKESIALAAELEEQGIEWGQVDIYPEGVLQPFPGLVSLISTGYVRYFGPTMQAWIGWVILATVLIILVLLVGAL